MPGISTYGPVGDSYIDGVLSGVKWAKTSLTYSFPASASSYGSGYGYGETTSNFGELNLAQKAAVRAALANIASSVNLTFIEVTETASTHGALRYAQSDAPNTAWGYYPHPTETGGDSWYNRSSGSYDNPVKGNYAYTTFLHETGHALGLDHAHDGYVMPVGRDSMEYTVMSYRSYVGASVYQGYANENWGYAQSLMMYDAAALQSLYGANYATNSGDTGYYWSPATGEMFINGVGKGAAGGNRIFQTVWDGGGIDTYDLSSYTTGVNVDLRPGAWTTTSAAQLARLHYNGSQIAAGNIANALLYGGSLLSIIENAKGGSGYDTITGNQAANILWGNAGNDALIGADGHDMLLGGGGADRLEGGNGIDAAHYGDARSGLLADLLDSGLNTGDAAGDSYVAIERVFGSEFNDNLRGDDLANWVYGAGGDDILYGRDGDDTLIGVEGNDILIGGAGADRFDGGNGMDWAHYGDALAGVVADLLLPSANSGEAAGDSYVSIEQLFGSAFNDTLRGDNLGNWLYGAAGDDILYGRGGNDTLTGGDGNDMLLGGAGADHLDGGSGIDAAHYGDALAGVVADLLLPGVNSGDASGDSYVSVERLFGSEYNDNLRGDDFANLLYGAAGDDILYGRGGSDTLMGADSHDMLLGGAGADHLDGGNGIDAAHYGDAPAGLLADLLVPGLNTGDAAGDTYASIERVFGSEFNDNLRGDDLANWVYGAGGDDILYGRDGDDTLMGVEGNDILIGGAGADRFDGGNGFDWAHYGDAPAGVAADLLHPSANSGEATGDSYVSIDRLFGSGFNDTLSGDNFGNWIYGAAGDDILYGRDGNDTLMGVEGNDILIGGGGTDILGGGTGSDIFVFSGAAETSQSAADTILDFLSGVDHIDLSLMDANTNIGGDQAFFYSSAGGFTGAAGELIFAYGTLSGDINGDMSADFQVSFANATSLYATDFYL